jgi:hypothetical protein
MTNHPSRRVKRRTEAHRRPRDPIEIEWDVVIANLKAMLDRIEGK